MGVLPCNLRTGRHCKLVSQTYYGASVMVGRHYVVQTLVRQQCPQAIFVLSYAHQLNLVLKHSAKNIKKVKNCLSVI